MDETHFPKVYEVEGENELVILYGWIANGGTGLKLYKTLHVDLGVNPEMHRTPELSAFRSFLGQVEQISWRFYMSKGYLYSMPRNDGLQRMTDAEYNAIREERENN